MTTTTQSPDAEAELQSRLLRDLEPVVAENLERHLKVTTAWNPATRG